jgi:hypothetical protein
MQTNSFVDWTRLPLERGVCASTDVWAADVPAAPARPLERNAPEPEGLMREPMIENLVDTARREFVNEEKLRILKMLEEGKIDAERAVKLMDALDRADTRPSERELKKKWIHIQVEKDGRNTVNVKLPLALLKFGFKFAPDAMRSHRERAQRKAERVRRRAERMRHRLERKLEGKLGPEIDLDVEGIVNDAMKEAEEAMENGMKASFGHFLGRDHDLDLEKILEMAQSEDFDGKVLDVYDEDEDEHVVIKLE